jgi:hypothetical protein
MHQLANQMQGSSKRKDVVMAMIAHMHPTPAKATRGILDFQFHSGEDCLDRPPTSHTDILLAVIPAGIILTANRRATNVRF